MLKVPNVAELYFLEQLRSSSLNTCNFHLYKNDKTPLDTDLLADYTEADFPGYVIKGVAVWNSVFLNVDQKAETQAGALQWNHSGAPGSNSVFGYYATDSTNTQLLFAERFDPAPVIMANGSNAIVLLPRFTGSTEV